MSEDQFAMVSDWMVNGNINDFVKAHPDANRLELVGISLSLIVPVSSSLTIGWLIQLEGVARGLIYIHSQEMVHGDLKGVRFRRLESLLFHRVYLSRPIY